MTDWNLIVQGNISLLWIQECLKMQNANKTVKDLMNEFRAKYENCEILNLGSLFMATYLLFLYPKETELTSIDTVDMSKFKINTLGKDYNNESKNSYLIRRIRNSLAHGNFEIDNNLTIRLKDNNKSLSNYFEVEICYNDFGSFINEFMMASKNKKYST